jgi:DNA-binding GntR family transcriptional regulator
MSRVKTPTPIPAAASAVAAPGRPRKGDLHGNALSVLRSMIVSGTLAPGQRLNERELCEQIGVSRTPVREALKALTQEGLLEAVPNRSPVVATLDPRQIRELAEVVAGIEALAGELAATRMTDSQVAELGILHYTMLKHRAAGELPGYFEANKAFHRRIVEYAGNETLLWVWDLLALRVDRARYASNLWPERWQEAATEHGQILAKLVARDAKGTAAALRLHVETGLSVVVSSLEEGPAAI